MKVETAFAIIFVPVVIMVGILIVYSSQGQSFGKATIIHQTSWQGGDVQIFSNITVTYHQTTQSFVLNCDYYSNKTQVDVTYLPLGNFGKPQITLLNLPPGCAVQ